jgi:O-acetyl-ADP-ribose deacetylase (regulator of RNase III)
MATLIHKTGDMFTTDARAIGHGVNIAGVMGHGIAVQFRNRFPEMHQAYKIACKRGLLEPGKTMIWPHTDDLFVYNIASQDQPGRNARLDWLEEGVEAALQHADAKGIEKIALPRIGAGIGGLNWDEVAGALLRLAEEHKCDIEVWTLPSP